MYLLDLLQMTLASTYVPGFDSSEEVLYQITGPLSIEPHKNQMINALG